MSAVRSSIDTGNGRKMPSFLPLDQMWQRVEISRDDSDVALFDSLMLLGEMMLKFLVLGMVATVGDDRQRNRYRQLYSLVRANSLGTWHEVLDDVLQGPASQFVLPQAREQHKQLTQKTAAPSWQYEAVQRLHACLIRIDSNTEELPTKRPARLWAPLFVALRNKTRGHGAGLAGTKSDMVADLEASFKLFHDQFNLFRRPWAYLYRNLSGKYRVTKYNYKGTETPFEPLKTTSSHNYHNGAHFAIDEVPSLVRVELIKSDPDASNFFLPNGGFNGKTFEVLSYLNGDTLHRDASPYLQPATELPPSETQGLTGLDPHGQSFSNVPPAPHRYVVRPELEDTLLRLVRGPLQHVITLVGKGGVGKTSLAISVLHRIAYSGDFDAILWFSARDIDLLLHGPKNVKPHVLTKEDIADELVRLMAPLEAQEKGFRSIDYLAEALAESPLDKPMLFVFDNFETVDSPADLFNWLVTYLRPPNKIIITTRHREFNGDWQVPVAGMTYPEAISLTRSTAEEFGIDALMTKSYIDELYDYSEGHPYIIKVLLGEAAKARDQLPIRPILASKDEVLTALFERTYANLSMLARRVFLTVCNWRSTIPELAVEAAVLKAAQEPLDVKAAIDELHKSSFVEVVRSEVDNATFISVPLTAAVFGEGKLSVSAMKSSIELDTQFLQAFGAMQRSGIKHGLAPRINRFFQEIARRSSTTNTPIGEHQEMFEFIARQYPSAWLQIASLYEEHNGFEGLDKSKDALKRYLEKPHYADDERKAWKRLATLCHKTKDWAGELHARVEMCEVPDTWFEIISDSANRLNQIFSEHYASIGLEDDEKKLLVYRLARLMEDAVEERGNATDCSRLAWLHLNMQDAKRAEDYTRLGLELDPDNMYCLRLADKLNIATS